MNASATMNPQWPSFSRWHNTVSWLLAALLGLLWLAGYGPGGAACKPLPTIPAISAPSAPSIPPVAAAPATPPAAIAAGIPAARVYFGLDRTELPGDTDKSLAAVVAYLKANPGAKAILSGFHDPSGNRAHNEELALNRARGVRGALGAAGIAEDRVVMQKPVETTGTGASDEARRVEVAIQP